MVENDLQDENTLIQKAMEGEASAFGDLYDHYQPKLYRFIYLKVSHREEAEDLTHQVFLKAWRSIPQFKDQGLPLSSWLYRIARNHVIDFYRTRKSTFSIDETPEGVLEDEDSFSDLDVEKKMQLEKVMRALKELSDDYQSLIILRYIEDLSYTEIAQSLGRKEGTIRVLHHRALKKLQTIIEKETHHEEA